MEGSWWIGFGEDDDDGGGSDEAIVRRKSRDVRLRRWDAAVVFDAAMVLAVRLPLRLACPRMGTIATTGQCNKGNRSRLRFGRRLQVTY